MKITNVQINYINTEKDNLLYKNKRKLIGFATITFGSVFVVNSIKVYEPDYGENKIFIEMPDHPVPGAEKRDTCFPINNYFRHQIETRILEQVKKDRKCQSGVIK